MKSPQYGRPLEAEIATLKALIETLSKRDYLGLISLKARRQKLIEELDEHPKENQHDGRRDRSRTV